MKKHIANIITTSRIICSIILLLPQTYSPKFFSLYLFCGFTDMIDGTIARRLHSDSELSSRLDSLADITFVVTAIIKFIPVIQIPHTIWFWIITIAFIKLGNILLTYIKNKKFISLHTVANKITGLILFIFPLSFKFINPLYSSVVVCSMASFSAVQESYYIIRLIKNNRFHN